MSQKLCIVVMLTCLVYATDAYRYPLTESLSKYHFRNVTDIKTPYNFLQKVDHLDPRSNKTFQQRYWVNAKYYDKKDTSPIFILVNGEAAADADRIDDGHWIALAKTLNALCFMLEHRYYGNSWPTEDVSTENLRFLTATQALADTALFIESMANSYSISKEAKWVAFGGSYSGALVTWLRNRYPMAVDIAIASSAPILAKTNFNAYYSVVIDAINTETGNNDCIKAIAAGTKLTQKHYDDRNKSLDTIFRTCSSIVDSNELDRNTFFESLASLFAEIVQYNDDNRPYSKLYNVSIKTVCGVMTNQSLGDELERLAKVNSLILDTSEQKCLENNYRSMILDLKNTSWSYNAKESGRQWLFQTCTEFGFYQTSDEVTEIFGEEFGLDYFIGQCRDVFGSKFNKKSLDLAVQETNEEFGGLDVDESGVIFVHGSYDPWKKLGITFSEDPQSPAILIPGTAHCANMYEPRPTDRPSLKEARLKIEKYLRLWLADVPEEYNFVEQVK